MTTHLLGPTSVRFMACVLGIAAWSLTPTSALAAPPRMVFDAAYALECQDVTTEAFAAANPGEKLVEMRFRVSMLLMQGSLADVDEVVVNFFSPERRLRVIDFAPRNEMASEFEGPIETVHTRERTENFDARLTGTLAAGQPGIGTAQLTPTLGTGTSEVDAITEKYRRLPPADMVVASGTVHGGHGVFFKLKSTPQHPLEGVREFFVTLAVPRNWRGDWGVLNCQARGYNRQLLSTRLETVGQGHVCVGLYLAGDADSRTAAQQLAQLQGQSADRSARRTSSTGFSISRSLGMPNVFGSTSESRRTNESAQVDPTEKFRAARATLASMAGV